jgi:uncharacterized protein (TIGR02687 family)
LAAYQTELFRFDQLYRQINHAADGVEPMGWALLHELRERIESAYSGWFVPQLGSAWSKVLEGKDGLLSSWRLAAWVNQPDFFATHVMAHLDAGIRRVFVVISDAFRYEAAEELVRDINGKSRFKAALSPMLGVLPSYTALGMASLLPHHTLAYRTNSNLDVMADDAVVSTLEQRSAHLGKYRGLAVKADELLAMGKDKGREFVRDRRVIYVYHDRIDMLGDKQGSEGQTFDAVARTLAELNQLASFIVNSLNGSLVLITADHGFLYQESALDGADRIHARRQAGRNATGEEALSAGAGDRREQPGVVWQHGRYGGDDRRRRQHGFLAAQRRCPLSLCRRRPFRSWQRHAAGDRHPGDHPARE